MVILGSRHTSVYTLSSGIYKYIIEGSVFASVYTFASIYAFASVYAIDQLRQ